ncbi:MAG TPA: hypothetical protein VM819_18500 [Vicinamibacterales bacterium]|nr:hypothetical protein [Vicinamibacterales bacterium]
MQSGSQIPPDFSIGYGTEIEESGGWPNLGLVILTLVVAAFYLVRRRKAGKKS